MADARKDRFTWNDGDLKEIKPGNNKTTSNNKSTANNGKKTGGKGKKTGK